MNINNRREMWIARTCISATLVALAGFFTVLFTHARAAYNAHDMRAEIVMALFAMAMFFMAYGNLLYQICLAGYHKSMHKHRPARRAEIEALYDGHAPSLTIVVPSYKEEHTVIWQTLVSAALAEYPKKEIVLLVDDPHHPKALEDVQALESTRKIPFVLQQLFDAPLVRFQAELEAFQSRMQQGKVHSGVECNRLSLLYDEAADVLDAMAAHFLSQRNAAEFNHIDRFFIDSVIGMPARAHRERAQELRSEVHACSMSINEILRQYKRLCGLFGVQFKSFERKKYANLSHEANKAMNINSYVSLMGKSWKEVEAKGGLILQQCTPEEADFTIAAPDFVNTIDADSQMLSDYALRLVHMMLQPENSRVAVIQSPCSAYPGATGGIERAAGAAIDMQFETHIGYTRWNATFWVGANAMLRYTALADVCEVREENGYPVSVFIKDRTVIEDTESSIDLVHRGWQLRNYPARLTFSSMPPDFGSLLIQRRRWANGGLLILPNLFRYAMHAPKNLALLKECFMRFHYLVSSPSGCLIALLLFIVSFGKPVETLWLPASMAPFFVLYVRDLRNVGYCITDMPRIFALNLMLLPVLAGGVLKSIEQIITGRKIPFSRTPKVPGRTAAPALYSFIEMILPPASFACAGYDGMHHYWVQTSVALVNAVLLSYALIRFLGIKATAQDISIGAAGLSQRLSAKTEDMMDGLRRRVRFLGARLQRG